MSGPRRGDVYLVSLDPTRGHEIEKTRPCLIVSPDELNRHLRTFLVAPMSTGGRPYPYRIPCRFQNQNGFIVVNQLRAVDQGRLLRHLGRVSSSKLSEAVGALQQMFAE